MLALKSKYQTSERQMPHITSPRPSKHLRQLHVKTIELQVGGWATPSNTISNITFSPYFWGKKHETYLKIHNLVIYQAVLISFFFQSFLGEKIRWTVVSIAIESPFPRGISRLKIPRVLATQKTMAAIRMAVDPINQRFDKGLGPAKPTRVHFSQTSPNGKISHFLPLPCRSQKKRPGGRLM